MKVIKISYLAIIWMVNLKFYRELKNSLYNVIFMIMTQVIRLVPTHPGQHDKNLLFFENFESIQLGYVACEISTLCSK